MHDRVIKLEQLCHHVVYEKNIKYSSLPFPLRTYQKRVNASLDAMKKIRKMVRVHIKTASLRDNDGRYVFCYEKVSDKEQYLEVFRYYDDLKIRVTICLGRKMAFMSILNTKNGIKLQLENRKYGSVKLSWDDYIFIEVPYERLEEYLTKVYNVFYSTV